MATQVVYWDASAILSLVTEGPNTESASAWYSKGGVHLVSTLAFAECCATLSTLERKRALTVADVDEALEVLAAKPFSKIAIGPEWEELPRLAGSSGLRGADLWHLALALRVRSIYFPGLRILTYDSKLKAAAARLNLEVRQP